jgi:DNA-binding NarL/FixJ family response regulator
MSIRIVIADDHPIVLRGLTELLRQQADIEVLATCADGDQALQAVREFGPDVLVLDLKMAGKGGLDVLAELHESGSPVRVLLLTGMIADDDTVEAVRLGVGGIVLKDAPAADVVDAIREVHEGRKVIAHGLLTRALDRSVWRASGAREAAAVLTAREIEIVRLIAQGLRNREVAERLSISEGTVKIHLHNVYEKLHVDGRVELLLYARDKGLA